MHVRPADLFAETTACTQLTNARDELSNRRKCASAEWRQSIFARTGRDVDGVIALRFATFFFQLMRNWTLPKTLSAASTWCTASHKRKAKR
jgi:hypothetical protein